MVEEHTGGGVRINQPAGHLDEGESLLEAAVRETREETAYLFAPRFLIGIYQWRRADAALTYLRFAFGGELTGHDPAQALDQGIVRALWLSPEELDRCPRKHRSPLVSRCVLDYLAGRRYPLELVTHLL
jgi:8-oxo-dGTP pyrophosphatase MutT (NUDIX family)